MPSFEMTSFYKIEKYLILDYIFDRDYRMDKGSIL